jgi:hypothetical protein
VVTPETEPGGQAWRGSGGPAELREAWRQAALDGGWTRPGDWWTAEVDAVVEALAGGGDALAAVTRLGQARADAAVGIREALDDLCALYQQLPAGGPPLTVVRALVEAWTEVAVSAIRSSTCEDPLSGLATAAYLRTRVAEVYREAEHAGTPAGSQRVLLVLQIDDLVMLAGWESLLLRLALGDCLRSVFSGGETLASVGPSTVIGLIGRDHWLPGQLKSLRARLADLGDVPELRIWTEALPRTLPAAYDLIESTGRPA